MLDLVFIKTLLYKGVPFEFVWEKRWRQEINSFLTKDNSKNSLWTVIKTKNTNVYVDLRSIIPYTLSFSKTLCVAFGKMESNRRSRRGHIIVGKEGNAGNQCFYEQLVTKDPNLGAHLLQLTYIPVQSMAIIIREKTHRGIRF